jgi:hypothetical protein
MRLEPVYLVSPRPIPPAMSSRRAFLLAGATFVAGSALGGACGYSLAASAGKEAGGGDADLATSGDAELDELRRLAVKAPIEELVQRGVLFLNMRDTVYPKDEVLWRGVARLAQEIIARPDPIDRSLVLVVAATIERGGPPKDLKLEDSLPRLREIRSSKRR